MRALAALLTRSAVAALFLCLSLAAKADGVVFGSATAVVETAGGATHAFAVELAVTPDQRARGLMERTELASDAGMIFDFGIERDVMMWMKNTPLSLDMVFIAEDGEIASIAARTEPYSEAIITSGAPVRYVLEINGGRAGELGITAGDRVRLRDISNP